MPSDFPRRLPSGFLIFATFLAVLLITTSARADEVELYRGEFHNCPDQPLDNVHPRDPQARANVHFYYIADLDDCPESSGVSVRHTVKNLHPKNPLSFSWEETDVWHKELLPGRSWGNALPIPNYDGQPFASYILYGPNRSYSVSAMTYPLPRRAAVTPEPLKIGDVRIANFNTEYIDSRGLIRHISVQITSIYQNSNLTSYSISKEPPDLVLALGALAETSVGQLITTSLSADVGPLEEFIGKDRLSDLPVAFAKEQFLIVPAYSSLPDKIEAQVTPTATMIVPVAILSEDFEPIATNAAAVFVP